MSLGYNFNRNPKISNLGGNTGANVIPVQQVARRRARSPPMSLLTAQPPPLPKLPTEYVKPTKTTIVPSPPPIPKQPSVSSSSPPAELYEDVQFVYATAHTALSDRDTQEIVAKEGERIMLIYPQQVSEENGSISMRLKRAHPVTGQLKLHWVCVYDPEKEDDDAHLAGSFSLVP